MNHFIIAIPHNILQRDGKTVKYIIAGKGVYTSLHIFDDEIFKINHKRYYISFSSKDYENWIYTENEKDKILNYNPNIIYEYFSIKEDELNDFDFEFHVNNFNLLMDII